MDDHHSLFVSLLPADCGLCTRGNTQGPKRMLNFANGCLRPVCCNTRPGEAKIHMHDIDLGAWSIYTPISSQVPFAALLFSSHRLLGRCPSTPVH